MGKVRAGVLEMRDFIAVYRYSENGGNDNSRKHMNQGETNSNIFSGYSTQLWNMGRL